MRRTVAAAYHINSEDEFISFTCNATIDLVDLYELLQQLLSDGEFQASWPQLIDLRKMELDLRPGALKPFVRFLVSSYRPKVDGAIAIVLDDQMSADFCAGVYRLACSFTDTEVFDDYAQAIKWLLQRGWPSPATPNATASV